MNLDPLQLTATLSLGAAALLFVKERRARWEAEQGLAIKAASLVSVEALAARASTIAAAAEKRLATQRTRLAAAEELAADTSSMAAVGRLAAGVAHEINNPLAVVKANLACLAEDLADGPEVSADTRALLEESAGALKSIQRIVAGLQQHARPVHTSNERSSLAEVVQEALRLASPRLAGLVTAECSVSPRLPRVRADRRHLIQAVFNLIMNAADAVDEVKQQRPPELLIRASERGGQVTLCVEDNGVGLPLEVQLHMFEPFFTTKPLGKGTGLGLSTSRELVHRYGGTLLASSRSSGGASLTVRLPAEPSRALGLHDEEQPEMTVSERPPRASLGQLGSGLGGSLAS